MLKKIVIVCSFLVNLCGDVGCTDLRIFDEIGYARVTGTEAYVSELIVSHFDQNYSIQ